MPPQRPRTKPSGPPSIYATAPERVAKKAAPKIPVFVRLTHSIGKAFKGLGKGAKFTPAQADAIGFMGYPITPEEFYATYKAIFMLGIVFGAVVGGLVILSFSGNIFGLLAGVLIVLAPIGASFLYLQYPSMQVQNERVLAIAYIPEIINYLVMSMRLTPNLEKSVEFAANHGRGKIAEDLKKLVWDVQIGKFRSIEEGLDDLAYRWGPLSDDFKHALMLVRSSVLETDRTKREELLEKAVTDVLEGSKEKMDLYARALHQPTVYLYYFGILLPLMLAIVLPIAGSIMQGMQFGRPEYLVLIYNIAIPIGIFLFGRNILAGRPPTYVPPEIPENFPGLPPKGTIRLLGVNFSVKLLVILVLSATIAAGYFADQINKAGIPEYRLAEELPKIPHLAFFDQYGLYVAQFSVFGILIGISLASSVYLLGTYWARKKVQDEIRGMEGEFKDAMYVLASRLGENKPMEEAMRHAVEFLPKSKIASEVFQRILSNITMLGMTLDAAIFDPTFGAVKNVPSQVIRGGMSVLVDSVQLGVNVAAKSLMSLSLQLRNAQKIDESLRHLLEDVTVMLSTMATFIAPVVLAVVSSMQQMIINSISSAAAGSTEQAQVPGMGGGMTSMFSHKPDTADPATFALIMGVYVIEIVFMLIYFNSQVEDTHNPLHTYVSIAKALPMAAILYCVTLFVTSMAIGGAGG
ncbi:MAG: hypothetical protein NTY90_02310 [Candidatus Micrarchaeota archaeon]|nr:hypothetical protein [Candidatus Micrarchaeota archaeon]